jgi:hypothetical protein
MKRATRRIRTGDLLITNLFGLVHSGQTAKRASK